MRSTEYQNAGQFAAAITQAGQRLTFHDPSQRPRFEVPPDKGSVRETAVSYAKQAARIWAAPADADEKREALLSLCAMAGVEFPKSRFGLAPSARRMLEKEWWQRKLTTAGRRAFELRQIAGRKVHKRAALYCSDWAVHQWRAMRKRNAEFMQEVFVFNDDGWLASLGDIAKHSLANPEVRRAEMMTRLRGMEEYAQAIDHGATFLTITCPGRYHANAGSDWNGFSPKQAQEYLCSLWARIRAKLARLGIHYYGFRVAEPHNDGCPHWHLILFAAPENLARLEATCQFYAYQEAPHELVSPQARKARFHAERIKLARGESGYKGGAVAYVAKYISKNIDGRKNDGTSIGEVKDRDGSTVASDAIVTAERVLAWASLWGIRQFQQVGGELIGPWRELRRVHQQITASAVLEVARGLADAGDFGRYLEHAHRVAGLEVFKRCAFEEAYDANDLQAARDALNRFGEPTFRVIGVSGDGVDIITRRDDWRCLTEAAIHACYDEACDLGEAVDFWSDVLEMVNCIRAEREGLPAPPGVGLDLCQ